MTDGDFAGKYDFCAGDVRGIRCWKIDPTTGKLASVYRPYLWDPMRNTARCLPTTVGPAGVVQDDPLPRIRRKDCEQQHKHNAENPLVKGNDECYREHLYGLDPDHSCGFWAYTITEHNPYINTDSGVYVMGIIQGYGRTVIGTKGFRCWKANILALALPLSSKIAGHPDKINAEDKLRRIYSGVEFFGSVERMVEAWPLGDHEGIATV